MCSIRFPAATLALFLCLDSLAAQATSWTVPPGFVSKHNGKDAPVSYSPFFGSYSEGTMQIVTADWTGKGAKSLKKVSARRDADYYYAAGQYGHARSWKSVRISVGYSKFAGMSKYFTANLSVSATQVFSAGVSWPNTSALPPKAPAWGSNGMAWNFGLPFSYSGKQDFGIQFEFRGGKLANGSTSPTHSR